MTSPVQTDLFAQGTSAAFGPPGFELWPDVLSAEEQADLVAALRLLAFKPYEHLGYQGHRRIIAFGSRYDLARDRLETAGPWPAVLQGLMDRLARRLPEKGDDFVQALISEYAPGAGIGWHRDRPVYGRVVGVSLLAPCVLRLRCRIGARWRRAAIPLAPGSVYRLSGEARSVWEHSITPMTALRYSITFRTLAG